MKILRVVWRDHFTLGGWQEVATALAVKEGVLVETVGYLVKQNAKVIVIAQSLTDDGFGDITVIIKSCIEFKEALAEVGDDQDRD